MVTILIFRNVIIRSEWCKHIVTNNHFLTRLKSDSVNKSIGAPNTSTQILIIKLCCFVEPGREAPTLLVGFALARITIPVKAISIGQRGAVARRLLPRDREPDARMRAKRSIGATGARAITRSNVPRLRPASDCVLKVKHCRKLTC